MYARGAGQAVAQLDVNYGVDFEPFKVNDRSICAILLISLKHIYLHVEFEAPCFRMKPVLNP